MKLLQTSISALFTAFTLVSSSLVVVQTSFADTSGKMGSSSSLSTPIVNKSITESEVLAAQRAWGEALVAILQHMIHKVLRRRKPWLET
jgi:hypothetical protein